ncbi:MAG: ABC transporter ATP-binding protein [Chitinophagales bacterium]
MSKRLKRLTTELKAVYVLLRYLRPYRFQFLAGFLALVASGALLVFTPFQFKRFLTTLNEAELHIAVIFRSALILGLVFGLQAVLVFLRNWIFEWIGLHVTGNIRKDIFSRLLNKPMLFFESEQTGNLTSSLFNDVSLLQTTLSIDLAKAIQQITIPVFCIPLMIWYSPFLTAVSLILIFPILILLEQFGRKIKILSTSTQRFLSTASVAALNALNGILEVKIFGMTAHENQKFANASDAAVQSNITAIRNRNLFILLFFVFAICGALLLFYLGLNEVKDKKMLASELFLFLSVSLIFFDALNGLIETFLVFKRTAAIADRIEPLLTEISAGIPSSFFGNTEKAIFLELESVSFAYPQNKESKILEKVNLNIKPGEKVGILGASGAGKTTLLKLISGLYLPDEGIIKLDGMAITAPAPEGIAYVPQETFLFDGTIKENICYGDEGVDEVQLKKVLKIAGLETFISRLSSGLNSHTGDGGILLSTGQKQRIALARALYRKPRLLLLDEATASLDIPCEEEIKSALSVLENVTMLIVAHRSTTIENCDRLIVIEDGAISHFKNVDELKHSNSTFANLLTGRLKTSVTS